MKVVVLGLSITSSWGNGHATNYRGLCDALLARGHGVLFLERDRQWYAAARDFEAPWVRLYQSVAELAAYEEDLRAADLVLVGSFVPDGVEVGEWALATATGPVAFWDIDTPVTAAKLAAGDDEYLSRELVGRYDLYLSFTSGPLLERIGAARPRPFHCLVDPARYRPVDAPKRWALGYLGTYSPDRQGPLDRLLSAPAAARPEERFVVAGSQFPDGLSWPSNVERLDHVAPVEHPRFYASQRMTLNVTRGPMAEAGWSPSVRLFEAAACGVPVVSDPWKGLETFFRPGEEILVAAGAEDVLDFLRLPADELAAVGRRARGRVLAEHTAKRRVEQLERYAAELIGAPA